MSSKDPDIEEFLAFLRRADTDPKVLERLRETYPNFDPRQASSALVGFPKPAYKPRLRITVEALGSAEDLCKRAMRFALRRLRRADFLQLVSKFTALMGSTGAIVAILNKFPEGSLISAGIATAGALASVVAEPAQGSVLGGSLAKNFGQLLEAWANIQGLAPKLEALEREDIPALNPDEVIKLIEDAAGLVKTVNRVAPLIPGVFSEADDPQ
jgi:hypothetical protein